MKIVKNHNSSAATPQVAALQGDVTRLLDAMHQGEGSAANQMLPLVYRELRTLAKDLLRREQASHTLQPTALVHEAYLKLVRQNRARFESRSHFLAVAATAMRRILVNHAKRRKRIKRGGLCRREPLTESVVIGMDADVDLVALDEAMQRLNAIDPRKVKVVEMRYFVGMSVDEAAEALQVSSATVKRDWEFARAWLLREVGCDG